MKAQWIGYKLTSTIFKVAAKINALGPGKCVAIPADLQKVEDIKKIVNELSKYEDRKWLDRIKMIQRC